MDALKGSGCNNDVCKALKTQAGPDAIACTKKQVLSEDVGLTGCEFDSLLLSLRATLLVLLTNIV
jgi:hypothetical protein